MYELELGRSDNERFVDGVHIVTFALGEFKAPAANYRGTIYDRDSNEMMVIFNLFMQNILDGGKDSIIFYPNSLELDHRLELFCNNYELEIEKDDLEYVFPLDECELDHFIRVIMREVEASRVDETPFRVMSIRRSPKDRLRDLFKRKVSNELSKSLIQGDTI